MDDPVETSSVPARPSVRPLLAAALLLIVLPLLVLPVSAEPLGKAMSFLPALLAVIACFDVMSVYLLVGEFRDSGDRRVLVMSCAYMWSLVTMAAYAAAFPGVLAAHPPLALTPSMAPWFYIAWHGGFPVLIGIAWTRWPASWSTFTPTPARQRQARIIVTTSAAGAAAVVTVLTLTAAHLPVLIHGLDTSAMTSLTAPVTVPLTILSLITTTRRTWRLSGPERWAPVVIGVCLTDLVLTYAARHRYSVGWYAGRTLTLIASGVVLVATIAALRRAKSAAHVDSLLDALTGLANRRSGHRDLALLIELAGRTATPLSVVSFDIDGFKAINDEHGHEAGDKVLTALGQMLPTWLRSSDVSARVGGEEFLLVLPSTATDAAFTVAEKIRVAVLDLSRDQELPCPVSISLGVASLLPDADDGLHLLRRADEALYQSKHAGKNRTTVAAAPRVPRPRPMPASATPASITPDGTHTTPAPQPC